jgi:hypothetical protein
MEDQTFGLIYSVVLLTLFAFYLYVGWQLFEKADRAGWKSIIPIYNLVVMMRIVGRPGWWVILALIPGFNLIPGLIVPIDLAKSFGKGVGFGIGLILLAPVFGPILALGGAQYQGPAAADDGTAPATA